jgi:DNA-binding MarR family transcriptional regulator/ribosomal protein S18 acetylase RimI-like enzyme
MDSIDQIRAFNRLWTARIGLLTRSYLDSGLGLTEVRVLHDLVGGPVRARALAQTLGIDEGYLSRILRTFETRGWLTRRSVDGDARARDIALTTTGIAAAQSLMTASRMAVAEMLAGLDPVQQALLDDGLACATAAFDPVIVQLRALEPGDAGWIVARHAALYAADEGFDATFEALVAEILAAFIRNHDPARERGWIAAHGAQQLGSIFCVQGEDGTAKLRLFFVEKAARGTGLAQQMLETCMAFARDAGYPSMRLWTHESHRAAGRLYARNGFALTDSRATRSFGQDVVEQTWERAL